MTLSLRSQRYLALPSDRYALAIPGIFLLLVALVIGGAWSLIEQDRARELERQRADLHGLARALEEHAARTFGQMDAALAALGGLAMVSEPATRTQLVALTHDWLQRNPHVATLELRPSADGQPPIPQPMPEGRELYIGLPGRDGTLPLARRLSTPELFAVGAIRVDYFERFYREIPIHGGDQVRLLDRSGRELMSFPLGRAATDAPHIEERRTLQDYPLELSVRRPMHAALADFEEKRLRLLLAAGALLSLLGAFAWLAHSDARRSETSRRALADINASLEERVRQRTQELEQTNRELMSFSYSVSHDLRAPLRAINGFAHALREDNQDRLDDASRDYLERICRASVRMGELIDELLKLANVSRQPLNLVATDLTQLAREVLSELQESEPDRVVHIDLPHSLPVEGDEPLLRDALANLLGNAWKFTRDMRPAQIALGARDHEGATLYWVSDNGVGFDMAHARKLFQPFQRLHQRADYAGTGIGLATVQRIIERHGGRCWADARPGQGATFYFSLPRRDRRGYGN